MGVKGAVDTAGNSPGAGVWECWFAGFCADRCPERREVPLRQLLGRSGWAATTAALAEPTWLFTKLRSKTLQILGHKSCPFLCGAVGYLAVEVITQGLLSKAADVYAFGMLSELASPKLIIQ